jgi:dolichol-phosphate mannosyltransferase
MVVLSVVVPSRNESENVAVLIRRLRAVLTGLSAEILFMDDSDDETPEAIGSAAWSATPGVAPVRCFHRRPASRRGGLSGAVVAGLKRAAGDVAVVMDSDLQHPPESIPKLLAEMERSGSDVVVASRYVRDGDAAGLGTRRRALTSHAATGIARMLFPGRLRHVSDPMSGFFAVRLSVLNLAQLRPVGFKILLETIVRSSPNRISEVGFTFGERGGNQSKAGFGEGVRFLRHLVMLRASSLLPPRLARLIAFGSVGVVGVGVNTLALYLLLRLAGLNYLVAAALSTQVSTTFNFLGAECWVFRGQKERTVWGRYWRFSLVNNVAMVARLPVLALLVQHGMGKLTANAVTLLLVFLARFLIADRVIYKAKDVISVPRTLDVPRTLERSGPVLLSRAIAPDPVVVAQSRCTYKIHDILTIVSDVTLPELECFRLAGPVEGAPDIDVRISRFGRPRGRALLHRSADGRSMSWEEHLGWRGANFKIDYGDTVAVTASPGLAASPHVLYTNVIEALLRFMLVERGYMLLHSACLQMGDRGIMLSARTDTGKTGTILKLLRNHGGSFLSDDMTIIDSNGIAQSYPKPLTISHHTLRALEAGDLTRSEWRRLRVQSRIHSKEGRGFAMKLAQHNLPILSINGLMQRIVPPPKYDVQRLVPCGMSARTRVEELFIIERGSALTGPVDPDEALEELIENTEDAYGFPPYRYLAPTMMFGDRTSTDLRARERAILASALENIQVHRHRSANFGWADTIASHVADNRRYTPPARDRDNAIEEEWLASWLAS